MICLILKEVDWMNNSMLRLLIIPLLVIIIYLIVNYIRNKIYKPKYEDKVQKPGKLEGCIVKIFIFLTIFFIIFAVLGLFLKELEMAIVFGCLALLFLFIIIILKRAHDTSYQENSEYFVLKIRNREYQVFYDNIVDWQPSYNEIALLDKTKPDEGYIKVNIKIFKPEILLRKIADMAFDGKFYSQDQEYSEDPNREVEIVNYLANYNYSYLVEDYIRKIEDK